MARLSSRLGASLDPRRLGDEASVDRGVPPGAAARAPVTRQGALPPIVRMEPMSRGEPFYITTPIFYVNDVPHIGHA
ncbi:hypothetical protein, partial [Clavibacter michiganensis]|uniref:hypothetical protein n=1 Tax=Clavibacter michiganensis TaxID=28447 RepID=UPI001F4E68FD